MYKIKTKQKAYQKKWETENRLRRNQQRNVARWGLPRDNSPKAYATKAWMIKLKSKPCLDCKKRFPVCCMDFDHRPGTKKLYEISKMFSHHYSRKLIRNELRKCDLVCANCHRIRTRDRNLGG